MSDLDQQPPLIPTDRAPRQDQAPAKHAPFARADDRWHYDNLEAWIVGELAVVELTRIVGDPHHTWCPKWWLHPDALRRLRVLWHTWEDTRLGITAEADYYQLLAFHLDFLTNPAGPFRDCRLPEPDQPGTHHLNPPPRLDPTPPGIWNLTGD